MIILFFFVSGHRDKELRKLGGHYAQMWHEQLQSGEIDTDTEAPPATTPQFTLYNNDLESVSKVCCYCQCHGDYIENTQTSSHYSTEDILQALSDEEEIEIPVKMAANSCKNSQNSLDNRHCNIQPNSNNGDEDSSHLVAAGTVYDLKPRYLNYDRMVSVPAHPPVLSRSLSETENSSSKSGSVGPMRSHRSYTHDTTTTSFIKRPPNFSRQISCPSYKCRMKEAKQNDDEKEMAMENERERVNLLREEDVEYMADVLVEDCLCCQIVGENDQLLNSMTRSSNTVAWKDDKPNCFSSDTVINMPNSYAEKEFNV